MLSCNINTIIYSNFLNRTSIKIKLYPKIYVMRQNRIYTFNSMPFTGEPLKNDY